MSRLLDNLLLFGRVLRRAGVDVHPGRLLDLVDALGHVDLGSRDDVYHTCRTLLVHRQEQIPLFDRAFAAFWRTHHEETGAGPKRRDGASASTRSSRRPGWTSTPARRRTRPKIRRLSSRRDIGG